MDEQDEIQTTTNNGQQTTDKLWLVGCFVITAIATFVRFYDLALKPLHHDEGVNGFFLTTLFREGVYKYDPANYHGPTLYYISLAFTKVFGLETLPIRWSVAIFGVLTVVLAFYLWRYIGKIGALAAALFLALSPGMVYISRYFIHEMLFVFFTLAIVVAVLYFMENRKPGIFAISSMTLILLVSFLPTALNLSNVAGEDRPVLLWALRISLFFTEAILVYFIMRMLFVWDEGRPIYLILASASVALLFATKETGFITLGTMIIAFFCIWIWQKIYGKNVSELNDDEPEPVELTWKTFRNRLGSGTDLILIIAAVSFTFIYISILFFSSFFTYPKGILGAFEAYMIWTRTGTKDHSQNGWYAYLNWGYKLELPIFLLSAVGTLIAFIKARHRFAMFAGLWAFGLFLAYSIIPYKTPWLALSFILPMCIIAGYGINELATDKSKISKIIAGILTIAAVAVLGYQTYDLNFVRYDDEKMPYVYAHTKRDFLKLIDKIEYYAEKSGKGKDATIEIVSPDYWSMPWYMNNYKNAKFGGQLVDANTQEMIVASKAQAGELNERYGSHYKFVGEYPLRPGVDLYLLVRKDLADADTKELYQIE
jgi:uncharacterized protein (TIGR03663 family)